MGSLGWLRWVVRVGAFEVLVTLLPLISNASFEDPRDVGISTVLREHRLLKDVLVGLLPSSEVLIRPIVAPIRTATLRLLARLSGLETSRSNVGRHHLACS